ncbi:MAG: HAD family phosphatase [Bacteroidota bacterium]|nr:HAD family phosphatase [Bacteroidota bacterium]
MKNLDAIIFDLGGVILNIDYNLTREAFEKSGITNFHEMYSQAAADDLFENLETGTVAEEDFYNEFNKRIQTALDNNEIRVNWNAMLLSFREKSLEFLHSIKSKYKLYLLSNTNHIHLDAFNKIYYTGSRNKPFEKFFDKIYYSCEIGLRKPNADIYEFVLKENDLEAAKTLFIDDSVQNIEAANAVGLQTILLKPGMYIEDLGL